MVQKVKDTAAAPAQPPPPAPVAVAEEEKVIDEVEEDEGDEQQMSQSEDYEPTSSLTGDDDEDVEEEGDGEDALVGHLYELFTTSQGVNVTEALVSIHDSLEKTNKILYKILNTLNQKA
jgi:hypothetical protein